MGVDRHRGKWAPGEVGRVEQERGRERRVFREDAEKVGEL